MKDVEKIKPTGLFTNYIFKAIPLAFDESLSYYECLCGLLSYLKETVIPTVNNNADAIIEVQNLMSQLQNYVNNYFNNLDVQQEINNKLDEMVADGTFESLIDGYTTIPELTNRVENLEIKNNGNYIFIGDSYIAQLENNSWAHKLANKLNLSSENYYIFGEGGAGFSKTGNQNHNFLTLLQSKISQISNVNEISHIIVGGGFNDQENTSQQNLEVTIQSFINYCKTTFPNAKVYIGEFGWTMRHDFVNARNKINSIVIPAYKNCHNYGAIYLSNVELCFRDKTLYDDGINEVHPNVNGSDKIANAMYDALHNGYVVESKYDDYLIPNSETIKESNLHLYDRLNNGFHSLELQGSFKYSITHTGTAGFDIDLGVFNGNFMRRSTNNILSFATIRIRILDTHGVNHWVTGNITINAGGHLVITIPGGQLPTDEITTDRFYFWCTTYANGYLW